jgi:hypothetical protein
MLATFDFRNDRADAGHLWSFRMIGAYAGHLTIGADVGHLWSFRRIGADVGHLWSF